MHLVAQLQLTSQGNQKFLQFVRLQPEQDNRSRLRYEPELSQEERLNKLQEVPRMSYLLQFSFPQYDHHSEPSHQLIAQRIDVF